MPTIETPFSVEIIIYDEFGDEVNLEDYGEEVVSVAGLIAEGEITGFEEILGHLWMRIHYRKVFGD